MAQADLGEARHLERARARLSQLLLLLQGYLQVSRYSERRSSLDHRTLNLK
jgi:hypothetical protein